MKVIVGTLFVLTLAAGCSEEPAPPPPVAAEVDARPSRRTDSIVINGQAEPVTLDLVESTDAFPVRFTTYAPAGAAVEFSSDSAGGAVTFTLPARDSIAGEGYLHVRFLPPGTKRITAKRTITSFLQGRNAYEDELQEMTDWDWARDAYTFSYRGSRGEEMAGKAAVAEHAGHAFYLILRYPAAQQAHVEPLLMRILEQWLWEGGKPLIP